VTTEKLPKERDIFVPDLVADLLDGTVRALQVVPCGVDAQAVEVRERGFTRCDLESACKIARAHSHARS
jgi:hypothetical protein